MTGGKNWVRFFACAGFGLMFGGCGAYDAPGHDASTFESTETVGSTAQPVNEGSFDRPVAAVTIRNDEFFHPGDLYIFVCNSSHQLMLNVLVEYSLSSWSFAGWQRQTKKTCASTPTAVTWSHNLSRAGLEPGTPALGVVNVYWRDDNDQLWEVRYNEDGHTRTTNLSALLGLGPITGSPAVVDIGDSDSHPHAVSVAVRMRDTNQLFTVEFHGGSWRVLPVLLTSGNTASAVGTIVPSIGYSRGMMSAQLNSGTHSIYRATAWGQSFQQYAWTSSASKPGGVLSIGGFATAQPEVTGCEPNGCAMYRNPNDNKLMWVPIAAGGNLTPRVKYGYVNSFGQDQNALKPMGGSIWFDPTYPQDGLSYGRGGDGRLQQFLFGVNSWRSESCTNLPEMGSAPAVIDRQVVYAAVPATTIYLANLRSGRCIDPNPGAINLGIQPLL